MSSESGRFLRFNPATSVRRQSDVAEPRKRRAKTILDEGWPLQRSGHVPISLMESECYKMEAATCSGLTPFGWPKGLSQPVRRAARAKPDPAFTRIRIPARAPSQTSVGTGAAPGLRRGSAGRMRGSAVHLRGGPAGGQFPRRAFADQVDYFRLRRQPPSDPWASGERRLADFRNQLEGQDYKVYTHYNGARDEGIH
jgi:hypothetical protein